MQRADALLTGFSALYSGDDAVHGEAAYSLVDESQLELLYPRMADVEAGPVHSGDNRPPKPTPAMAEWATETPFHESGEHELKVAQPEQSDEGSATVRHQELPTLAR